MRRHWKVAVCRVVSLPRAQCFSKNAVHAICLM